MTDHNDLVEDRGFVCSTFEGVPSTDLHTADEMVSFFSLLFQTLTRTGRLLTAHELNCLARHPDNVVIVAKDQDGLICGMGTLALSRCLSGTYARIEDLVVLPRCRRRDIGSTICKGLLDCARKSGAQSVEVHLRPDHVSLNKKEAHRFFQFMGFKGKGDETLRLTLPQG